MPIRVRGILNRLSGAALLALIAFAPIAWAWAAAHVRPDGAAELAGAVMITAAAQAELIVIGWWLWRCGKDRGDGRIVLLAVLLHGSLGIYACLFGLALPASCRAIYLIFLILGAVVNLLAFVSVDA